MKFSDRKTRLFQQNFFFRFLATGLFLALPVLTFAAPGDLDTSFGSGGKIVTSLTNYLDEPTRVRIQPDGKIVTVGYSADFDFADAVSFLVRHNADGTRDNSFGTNGLVFAAPSLFEDLSFNDFAISTDGKFLVTGTRFAEGGDGGQSSLVIYRYTSNGTLDAAFGTNGVITTPVTGVSSRIVLQPDGKFVVAGAIFRRNSFIREVAVLRYNSNGTLDTTFGTDGKTNTLLGFSLFNSVREILVQTDGKLLVAGFASVLRYNPNGTLDNSFGANGIVQTDIDNQSNRVGGMALQPDGKIVVSGPNFAVRPFSRLFSSIVRYNVNGTLDNTFGTGGIVRITDPPDPFSQAGIAFALAIQQNGKILTAGERNGNFAISRYNPNGIIDPSFGTNGVVITVIENSNASEISSLALQADGKVVASGPVNIVPDVIGEGSDAGWVRYLGDSSGNDANFTGGWFDPAQSGHGLFVEHLDGNRIAAGWYTFAPDGRQTWLIGVGPLVGNSVTMPMLRPENGRFPPQFVSASVVNTAFGQMTLRFDSCDSGMLSFAFPAPFGSGTMPLRRPELPARITCSTASVAAAPDADLAKRADVSSDALSAPQPKATGPVAALTGSWANPNQSGHGFQMEVLSGDRLVVTWYVYTPTGEQMWLIGAGPITGQSATINSYVRPAGGRFIPNFNPALITVPSIGTLTVTALSCNSARVDYEFGAPFGSGSIPVSRITSVRGVPCVP